MVTLTGASGNCLFLDLFLANNRSAPGHIHNGIFSSSDLENSHIGGHRTRRVFDFCFRIGLRRGHDRLRLLILRCALSVARCAILRKRPTPSDIHQTEDKDKTTDLPEWLVPEFGISRHKKTLSASMEQERASGSSIVYRGSAQSRFSLLKENRETFASLCSEALKFEPRTTIHDPRLFFVARTTWPLARIERQVDILTR